MFLSSLLKHSENKSAMSQMEMQVKWQRSLIFHSHFYFFASLLKHSVTESVLSQMETKSVASQMATKSVLIQTLFPSLVFSNIEQLQWTQNTELHAL